ncbi:flavin reductase family protein [Rhodococcus sp. BP-252]|uniref:NADH-dependent flavin reductase n=1 Tax=unclassified Rhodococcus (in: high G+C Gram-positive bacteria) TaxID=192944 RepID=UPI000DF3D783|nr:MULTISPECIES: NADH-dependent flavin reductase [unclassified Rhodococcus (in: high G+C Gram-positive bacteria)]MBY6414368.1 flavin reductase family protein [Rhodococcus sp. BP-320]MBY6419505.1 flavin reductase family protein [Rhodococcus sp. BP-321]MBY6424054.1 flavin reductase family protein [Rhodococcus sp. BP-324]MBY6429265.1 flavin reductase family protein [Rhodococcus sp. BP-323]MBY6434224.1 flavin reductase family protein [Rhodococcus sp. BP-322]
MRKALGRFASGVTIVTTAESENEESVHGMTANAFTSVSLDPPLVLVSISTRAKMDARIRDTGKYGVSVLAGDQEPLSLHFANAVRRPDLVRFVWRRGVPLLEGALVHLSCTLEATYPAGDHSLHLGRVEELAYDDGSPLVFYTGSFRSLAVVGRDEPWGF